MSPLELAGGGLPDPRGPGSPERRDAVTGRLCAFGPRFVFQWHITDRCPLACVHCYRTAQERDLEATDLFRVYEKMRRFLERDGSLGQIHFAGGEPLTRALLPDLARRAHDDGMVTRVLTSGTVSDAQRTRSLVDAGCRWVQVSVEGPREVHDDLRGTGTFRTALDGARRMADAGLEVTLAMTLSRRNLPWLAAMADVGRDLARRLYFSRVVPVATRLEPLALSREQWRLAMRAIVDLRGFEVPRRDPTFVPLSTAPRRAAMAPVVGGCSAGYASLCVESNGDVYPCRRLPVVIGNLLRDEVETILASPLLVSLRNRDRLGGRCGRCVYRWVCGGCRAIAYAHSGDPLAEDPHCPFPALRLHPLSARLPGGERVLQLR